MTTRTAHPASAVPPATRPSLAHLVARWMVSFVGFPLGGVAAIVTVGHVDGPGRALLGGVATGLVLGAVQAWALRVDRRFLLAWIAATAVGLALGLTAATTLVDFGTSLGDLVVQGAASGLGVGLAQAVVLHRRVGPLALLWPVWLGGVWALGWAVTTGIGVDVDRQFTVFGSAGALTATALTAVLPIALARRGSQARRS